MLTPDIKVLLDIANELDVKGFHVEADALTNMVREAQMPGQGTPNPSAGMAQTPAMPANPQQQQTQAQQNPAWTSVMPNMADIARSPMSGQSTLNVPQSNQPGYSGNQYQQGWYSSTQANGNYNLNPQQLQQQLMNMNLNPLTAVQNGPNGPQVSNGKTMTDYANASSASIYSNGA